MGLDILFPDLSSIYATFALAAAATLILSPLEKYYPADTKQKFWRPELGLDFLYWFATPLLTRTFTALSIGLVLFVIPKILGLTFDPHVVIKGWGIVGSLPFWLQAIFVLIVADGIDYWTHRTLHRSTLWKIHAIHHTPQEMSWASSSRVHPLNDLITRCGQVCGLLITGVSVDAVIFIVPFISFYVMFLHSNLKWDFGPFRQILVSPAYHRWHHTSDEEGIDKNYAGIFPFWDRLFGTQHFPSYLPQRYGLKGKNIKESFLAHLLYPLVRESK